MNLDDFQFELPKELIAQKPAHPRDSARLLVYRRSDKSITDAIFRDIDHYLEPETTLVINRAKVDKTRLVFGKMEIFVLEAYSDKVVKAMVRPGKKFKMDTTVDLGNGLSAKVLDIDHNGHRNIEFNRSMDDAVFDEHRLTPLPPYIAQDESLAEEYQTVYAKDPGSKAAPTAGLHFTEQLLADIANKHPIAEVTLDVGLGTFAPISDTDVEYKKLHEETYAIDDTASKVLKEATHRTAVGTTSVRLLESAASTDFDPISGASTDIFIQPGDTLQGVDSLITNFHLPSTSLLMLVATFTGRDELMRIYEHAITEKYRFYSFGDAMLII